MTAPPLPASTTRPTGEGDGATVIKTVFSQTKSLYFQHMKGEGDEDLRLFSTPGTSCRGCFIRRWPGISAPLQLVGAGRSVFSADDRRFPARFSVGLSPGFRRFPSLGRLQPDLHLLPHPPSRRSVAGPALESLSSRRPIHPLPKPDVACPLPAWADFSSLFELPRRDHGSRSRAGATALLDWYQQRPARGDDHGWDQPLD